MAERWDFVFPNQTKEARKPTMVMRVVLMHLIPPNILTAVGGKPIAVGAKVAIRVPTIPENNAQEPGNSLNCPTHFFHNF